MGTVIRNITETCDDEGGRSPWLVLRGPDSHTPECESLVHVTLAMATVYTFKLVMNDYVKSS